MPISDDTAELHLPPHGPGSSTAVRLHGTVGWATHRESTDVGSRCLVSRRPQSAGATADDDLLMLIVGDSMSGIPEQTLIDSALELTEQAARQPDSVQKSWMQDFLDLVGGECSGSIGVQPAFTGVHIVGSNAIVFRIGDPEVCLLRGESCQRLTHDSDQGADPGGAPGPELLRASLERDDRLLLCTGNLLRAVSVEDLQLIVREQPEIQAGCDALVNRTRKKSADGDIVAALAHVRGDSRPA